MTGNIFILTKMGENICRGYSTVKILGRGSFGEVSKVTNKKGDEFASKITTSVDTFPQVLREIDILKRIDHPGLLSGRDFFFEGARSCVILDLMEGDMVDMVNSGRLTIEQSIVFVKQIACGLNYLHINRILHRDLKPDNVLFLDGQAKIADFGLSVNISPVGVIYQDFIGTREYCPPELLSLKEKKTFDYYYGEEVDNYAFAWVCMIILSINGRVNDSPETQLEYVLSIGCDPGPDFKIPRGDQEDQRRAYQRRIRWKEGVGMNIRKMIFNMIQQPPRQRPTAKDLFIILGGNPRECEAPVEYPDFPKNINYSKTFTKEHRQKDLVVMDEIMIWARKEFHLGNVAPSIELEAIDLYDRISMLFSVAEIETISNKIGVEYESGSPGSIIKILAAVSIAIDLFSTSPLNPEIAIRKLNKTAVQKIWAYVFPKATKFNKEEWYRFVIEVVIRLNFRLFRPTLERLMPTKIALEIMKEVLSPRQIVL